MELRLRWVLLAAVLMTALHVVLWVPAFYYPTDPLLAGPTLMGKHVAAIILASYVSLVVAAAAMTVLLPGHFNLMNVPFTVCMVVMGSAFWSVGMGARVWLGYPLGLGVGLTLLATGICYILAIATSLEWFEFASQEVRIKSGAILLLQALASLGLYLTIFQQIFKV